MCYGDIIELIDPNKSNDKLDYIFGEYRNRIAIPFKSWHRNLKEFQEIREILEKKLPNFYSVDFKKEIVIKKLPINLSILQKKLILAKNQKLPSKDKFVEIKISKALSDIIQYEHLNQKLSDKVEDLLEFYNGYSYEYNEGYNDYDLENNMIIFSRHPIDILRMSDFEHLRSCHSFLDKNNPDIERRTVLHETNPIVEAQSGGFVAYIVDKSEFEHKILDNLYDWQNEEIFNDNDRNIDYLLMPKARIRARLFEFDINYTGNKNILKIFPNLSINKKQIIFNLLFPDTKIYGSQHFRILLKKQMEEFLQTKQQIYLDLIKKERKYIDIISTEVCGGDYIEDNGERFTSLIRDLFHDSSTVIRIKHYNENIEVENKLFKIYTKYLKIDNSKPKDKINETKKI